MCGAIPPLLTHPYCAVVLYAPETNLPLFYLVMDPDNSQVLT
jgi:hypothetical protein